MYAVIGRVKLDPNRRDEALKLIEDRGIGMVRGFEGIVAGYWARTLDGDVQHSIWMFDSEQNARAALAVFGKGPPPGAPATLVSVELCEVVGQTAGG